MAAEMGILALIATITFLIALFVRIFNKFIAEREVMIATYYGSALIFIPWVFAYLMTDVVIFDERAFLMFVVAATLLLKNPN